MANMVADKCNRCGKIVVKFHSGDSSDMVQTQDSFLYMCDLKPKEGCRPCLQLKEYTEFKSRMYCLDCLLAVVTEWVVEMRKRGKSDIPLNHILLGNKGISSPCPVCGK